MKEKLAESMNPLQQKCIDPKAVSILIDETEFTWLEAEALRRCIASAKHPEWRSLLEGQLRHARIVGRTEKVFGYYIDFDVPRERRIPAMPDEVNAKPMEARATHPDGKNMIFFILYVKDGLLHSLEASSTSDWPSDESAIRFIDDQPSS
jgi:hypothetical protein